MRRSLLTSATALLLLTGCGDAAAPREGTSLEELSGDVSGAVDLDETEAGESVSLKATVTRVLSAGAFEIRAEDTATEEPVLVLNREDRLEAGQVVQVIGVVSVFDGDSLGEYAVPQAEQARREGTKVIVASEVDTDVPGDGS